MNKPKIKIPHFGRILGKKQEKHNPTEDKVAILKKDDVDFVTDSKEVVLSETYQHANLLLYVMLGFIVILLMWAALSDIDEITIGIGRVIPSGKVKVIQNLEGGIVESINVKEGDLVKEGQVLITLDPTRFKSSYRETRGKYLILLANIARLQAESTGAVNIDFPELVKKENPALIETETLFFKDRQSDIQEKLKNLQQSYELSKRELDIIKPLVEEKVMSQLDLIRIEKEVNDLKGQLDQTLEDFKGRAHAELNEKNAALSSVQEELIAEKDRLDRTIVRAPVNGVIKSSNVNTIGEVVKSGDNIIEIVPVGVNLTIEIEVNPSNIAFIHSGVKALAKITAYDSSIYGGIPAVVKSISADTVRDDRGNQFYKVKVETERNYVDNNGEKLPIKPGMTATVNIISHKKSVLEYILKPVLKAKNAAFRER
ncbi:MAG: type secretion rane fusion protein HlyD family [Gammaproteobacteria bacterium]|jgi:adhesin transport system membrane fusion protein|nr:type secretion rane fusion protein HlyD family [Gammaproteobacteria bacterium]